MSTGPIPAKTIFKFSHKKKLKASEREQFEFSWESKQYVNDWEYSGDSLVVKIS